LSTPPRQRMDAARNRERLVVEARNLFATASSGASLEAIAQAAGVGIGTLYRHFPTKEALVEAVYRLELDALDLEASRLLLGHVSADAMRLWMNKYAQFVATKHAMLDALRVAFSAGSTASSETRARIVQTIAKFLEIGARDGSIREDVRPDDVGLALAGMVFAVTASADRHQVGRMLDLLMAGLRRPSPPGADKGASFG
jgi:AcrR family transcriptional regulator